MSLDELQDDVHALREEVGELRGAVSELRGAVLTLSRMMSSRFDDVEGGVEKAASIRTAITFASVVIVPILVALIGGYLALRAGGSSGQ